MFSRDPHRHLLTQTPTDPQLPEIDEWEISASEIIIEDSLGEGAFGEVYKGVVKGPIRCTRVQPSLRNAIAVPVAIKLLKGTYIYGSNCIVGRSQHYIIKQLRYHDNCVLSM